MIKSSRLVAGLVVPAVVAVYIFLFWRDVSHMQLAAAGFPRLLILLLGALIVVQIIHEVRQHVARRAPATTAIRSAEEPQPGQTVEAPERGWRDGAKPMLVVVVFLALYIFILPVAGAYPSTAGFVGALMIALGYRRPVAIGLSMVICVALVAAFIETFNLPLAGFGS